MDVFFSCSSDEEQQLVEPSATASASASATEMITIRTMKTVSVSDLKTTIATKDSNKRINTRMDTNMDTGADADTDTDNEEEEEHTLTAFGDISLSEADFVPGVASALTSERLRHTKTSGSVIVRLADQDDLQHQEEKKGLRLNYAEGESSEMKVS